ncbi:MAG: hypothetical protein ABI837_04085, partial [Acidobacteriota bacterium]
MDFLLLAAFFAGLEALDDFFDAAIVLTTFHAVRDLPVAPTWQKTPDLSGNLDALRVEDEEEKGTPATFN